mmetsp:Transcript_619/g.1482  ORF Transcript_619/g.1482 Transcript_619/m.1482 type:complete len:392 (+) Transcript_619:209-1384(+)
MHCTRERHRPRPNRSTCGRPREAMNIRLAPRSVDGELLLAHVDADEEAEGLLVVERGVRPSARHEQHVARALLARVQTLAPPRPRRARRRVGGVLRRDGGVGGRLEQPRALPPQQQVGGGARRTHRRARAARAERRVGEARPERRVLRVEHRADAQREAVRQPRRVDGGGGEGDGARVGGRGDGGEHRVEVGAEGHGSAVGEAVRQVRHFHLDVGEPLAQGASAPARGGEPLAEVRVVAEERAVDEDWPARHDVVAQQLLRVSRVEVQHVEGAVGADDVPVVLGALLAAVHPRLHEARGVREAEVARQLRRRPAAAVHRRHVGVRQQRGGGGGGVARDGEVEWRGAEEVRGGGRGAVREELRDERGLVGHRGEVERRVAVGIRRGGGGVAL